MDEKIIEDTFECQMKQCEIECTVPYGGFSSCQRNLIKTFQIDGMIALITKMDLMFS